MLDNVKKRNNIIFTWQLKFTLFLSHIKRKCFFALLQVFQIINQAVNYYRITNFHDIFMIKCNAV